MPAWIPYTLLRLALFGGTFALVFVLLGRYALPTVMVAIIAALAGAIVSLTVSYIFFPTLRTRVSAESADDDRGPDERAEDVD